MSLPLLSAARPLASRIVAALLAFLFLALIQPAHSAPPVPAPPPFPVGNITAYPVIVQPATKPILSWSIKLPANANAADYAFFIRQKILVDTPIYYDMAGIASEGDSLSALAINPNGATFELWAVKTTAPARNYLLDSTIVGTYLPMATVNIVSEDPYPVLPRTRADRPFNVNVNVNGIISDPAAPEAAKGVTLLHHVQPYGPTGIGDPLDRTQATELSQTAITTNNFLPTTYPFASNSIPGENHSKVRGEERFSIFTREVQGYGSGGQTFTIPPQQIDSQTVQIWPVADASITGITHGQILGASVPQLTFQLNDLYPSSTTWAQVYQGAPQAAFIGATIPGSSVVINDSVPANRTVVVDNYGSYVGTDGLWTMELLTKTPFGTDRLARVSFMVNRTGTTITDWRQTHFGSPSNTGDGADGNDYDHDGIPNVIEFAFGFDPKQAGPDQLPLPERTADQLAFRFTPPATIAGIRYGAEWSTTLQPNSWTPLPNTGALPEQLFTLPTTGKPQLYLRLTAEQP